MRGLRKSKRISWAPDDNLCQVRLFLSEEAPSQVGFGTQDHLQAKASWSTHPTGFAVEDALPPGFERAHPANQLHINLSEIPIIKWRFPPRFELNFTWQVVAGEESKEVEAQKQREMRMLEAYYPRPSAIPPNPSVSADVQESHYTDDQQTPSIPITPIEDEDAPVDAPSHSMAQYDIPMGSQSSILTSGISAPLQGCIPSMHNVIGGEKPGAGTVLGVEPDVLSAAMNAISRNDHENIDQDLLVKILSNPELIRKLLADHGAASNTSSTPIQNLVPVPSSAPPPPPVALSNPAHVRNSRIETNIVTSVPSSSASWYPQPNGVGPNPNVRFPSPAFTPVSSSPSMGVPSAKDVNYYKNLIQQHGGERQELPHQQFGNRYSHQPTINQESANGSRPRDSKPKIMKPCIYFNSPKGCWHGANCAYQHDAAAQQRGSAMPEMQSAKRMKMDR
ncbi:zinc finger CCCH domain-containing protein 6-like [Tripterygium wilfordii]|uniref:Zinc finger CCCH domain-containing protein 6-like n=2 Tax=Tripterygium wilfordii TaxID=458696 RepID=A0A7J7D3D2_TRIWF|nr:zinc finger CCCH domain-containing protein 6-like [Tripterygium wilfordii]